MQHWRAAPVGSSSKQPQQAAVRVAFRVPTRANPLFVFALLVCRENDPNPRGARRCRNEAHPPTHPSLVCTLWCLGFQRTTADVTLAFRGGRNEFNGLGRLEKPAGTWAVASVWVLPKMGVSRASHG